MRGGFQAGERGLWQYAFPHIHDGVQPAAGASYSESLDNRWSWRLAGCTFTLTTDNNAANRLVTVQFTTIDGVAVVIGEAPVVVTASTSNQRFCGSYRLGTAQWNTNTDVMFSLLDWPMEGGRTFSITIANVQVGDQLSKIKLLWWRLPTNPSIVEQFVEGELE